MPRVVLGAALRIIRRRVAADPLALLAAVVIVLLASAIVVAGPVYASAVASGGLQRALADAPVRTVGVQVSGRYDEQTYAAANRTVTAALGGALTGTEATTYRSALSQSFELPGTPAGEQPRLAVLAFADRLAEQADLLTGAWPAVAAGDGPVEAVVSDRVAATLRLAAGDTLTVRPRLDGAPVEVRIAGTYRARDTRSVMWWDSPLETEGVETGSFTTYGPFFVAERAFTGPLAARGASAYWRSRPAADAVDVADLGALAARVGALPGAVRRAGGGANLSVATGLPGLLRPAQRSLLVSRGAIFVPTAQVAVLAAYAMLLATGLILESRHVETALLRARGASAGQVGVVAALEAAVVVVPATLLGPLVALVLVGALERTGPVADIGLPLQPHIDARSFGTAGLTAAVCATALVVPAILNARTYAVARRERGRAPLRALVSRVRLDLVVVALGVLLLWQLRRYGSGLTETSIGVLGVDPLLVAAPAVGLLAGALLVLRLVPVLARAADRWATGRRGLPGPLGAWQLARRPSHYSRPALLLTLALAIGVFAIGYTSTWRQSQQDRADYAVGADVRVVLGAGPPAPTADVPGRPDTVAAVRALMPVVRDQVHVSPRDNAGVIALDSATAASVLRLRDDLADRSLAELAAGLSEPAASPRAAALPGQPRRLRVVVGGAEDVAVSAIVRDAGGGRYRLPAAPAAGGAVATVSTGAAHYPLQLAGLELALPTARVEPDELLVSIAVQASDAADGDDWRDVVTDDVTWSGTADVLQDAFAQPAVRAVTPESGRLVVKVRTGGGAPPRTLSTYRVFASPPRPEQPLCALATDRLLEMTRREVGGIVPLDIAGKRRDVRIVGALRDVPTLDGGSPGLVVDLAELAELQYAETGAVLTPKEWWLATDEGAEAAAAAALTEQLPAPGPAVLDRVTEGRRLSRNPTAVGVVGGLAMALVAAALFAAVGFAVSVAVALRQRLSELALLRALGVSSRQLAGGLAVEQSLLIGLSLLGGTALGVVLTRVVVPAFVLTGSGAASVPAVRIDVPWRVVGMLELVIVLAAAAAVLVSGLAMREARVGSLLRTGGDT